MNSSPSSSRFRRWFLEGARETTVTPEQKPHHPTHPWWQVMCLTGVDYFSTLGYQPGIAFLAAGALSPVATIILVLLTLFGALPIYNRVAAESPNGQGSISMLEHLLPRWRGKTFVLCLLGFAATDFVITITLSAADATAHVIENPLVSSLLPHSFHDHPIGAKIFLTLMLLLFLGAIFLKGFKEAIGLAVFLVAAYLILNIVVLLRGGFEIFTHPDVITNWKTALIVGKSHGNPLLVIWLAILVFPKLALGLSGFETGVAVMPLVKGDLTDTHAQPRGRIANTRKLLLTAALIMSVMLIGSSFVTTLLIPPTLFQTGGEANGRALAFLAHNFFGHGFGTIYDLSTISILWFAGASAMAGLLNLVPRYLPRYGMAPEWAKANRPLVVVVTAVTVAVTWIFKADVEAQGGAYATGVLVLMTSAAVAVTLSLWKSGWRRYAFLLITAVFVYTTIDNIYERPEGLKIASFFIASIVATSLISRVLRSTELRILGVTLDEKAQQFIREAAAKGTIRIAANRPEDGSVAEYQRKEREARESHHIPPNETLLIFEVRVGDASDFADSLEVHGVDIGPYRVLRSSSPAVPNAIAAFLLHVRDVTGLIPHIYFGWTEGNPIGYVLKFIFFGEGDTAPVTREVLRQKIDIPEKRPRVHVG
ncbi:MAG: amino acid transporter [Blastocatellia bacterium]|nr:amino acid transporter [Blastocatellia bacterium]